MTGMWLRGGESIFNVKLDEEYYTESARFEDDDSKIQGQLRELRAHFPDQFHDIGLFQTTWVSKSFLEAMGVQRSNMAHRMRIEVGPMIFDVDVDSLHSPQQRHTQFRERIGWKAKANGGGEYDAIEASILHSDDYTGEFSWDTAFLNPVLMLTFQSIIRGPGGARALKVEKKPTGGVRSETLQSKLDIRHTTPGAIAMACVLARWTVSADIALQAQGASTGINYADDFDLYLSMLIDGLRKRAKPVQNIFRVWDDLLFPGTSSGLGTPAGPSTRASKASRDKAMALLDEMIAAEGDVAEGSPGGSGAE
ncbi:hypothetical protein PLICRDRAFT_151672 [Plicaturopsis crispa FD-325 SS-3]|nr:hypothetical protein PLICRDRAFT_151672 [Plicaturopsis crispa FD-325 SS-3]